MTGLASEPGTVLGWAGGRLPGAGWRDFNLLRQEQKVAQPKGLQGRTLHNVERAAQDLAQRCAPGYNIIEPRVDLAMVDDLDWLTGKERHQTAAGVCSHVRCQTVAHEIRQPVDKRCVAKMIAPLPIIAVCLEWVKPVGGKDHDLSTRCGHTYHLTGSRSIVAHVLNDFVREDHVEATIGKGQCFGRRNDDARSGRGACARWCHTAGSCLRRDGEINLDPGHKCAEAAKLCGVSADAATRIQDACALKVDPAAYQGQPSLLPGAPDI